MSEARNREEIERARAEFQKFGKRDSEEPATAAPVVENIDPRRDFNDLPDLSGGDIEPRLLGGQAVSEERRVTGLAQELWDCEAPAVGEIVLDLDVTPTQINAAKEGFAQVGAYAHLQRPAPRASVIQVSREPNGIFRAEVIRPDRSANWNASEEFFDVLRQPGGEPAALSALSALVMGVRDAVAVANVPLLVLIDNECFERSEATLARLKQLAADANSVVAVVRHQPGFGKAVFKAQAVETKPAEPNRPHEPTVKRESVHIDGLSVRQVDTAVEGLRERNAEGDYPEAISGPNGERIRVAYGQLDGLGHEYIRLSGDAEDLHGRMRPVVVRVGKAAAVPLDELRFYV